MQLVSQSSEFCKELDCEAILIKCIDQSKAKPNFQIITTTPVIVNQILISD